MNIFNVHMIYTFLINNNGRANESKVFLQSNGRFGV